MAPTDSDEPEVAQPRADDAPDTDAIECDEGVLPTGGEAQRDKVKSGRLKTWFGHRAKVVVTKLYETRADDIEERARRAVGSAYKDSADDLQERAVQAMRAALHAESDRIKEAIEHGIQVKKREVRMSLLVLVVASLLYLALYWATHSAAA